jgi:two-component system phosphate regulon sensor histidine kinase PhoR
MNPLRADVRLVTRLYAAIALLLIALFGVFQALAVADLAETAKGEVAYHLEQTGRLVESLMGDRRFDDALADSLGATHELRVTLIGADGAVLGDSDVEASRLSLVENHAGRPEVSEALDGRVGVAERMSSTVDRLFVYVAVPSRGRAIRFASSRVADHRAASKARWWMFLAEGALVDLAGGDLKARAQLTGVDRVASVGQAIDRLADALEERVEESDTRADNLRALFDGLEDAVAFVDADGTLQIRNPALERWVGQSVRIGDRLDELFKSPDIISAVNRAQVGETVTEELRFGNRIVLLSTRPHRGGAVLTLLDLTTLRSVEGVRRDFVANVSHELRTPLTSIMGFAEAIVGGELASETAHGFGERILANAARMRSLVDDLLDLSLIESGSWSPTLENVMPGAVALEVWNDLVGREVIALRIDDPDKLALEADDSAVRQILRNLLGNAIRYAPGGTRIVVGVRREGDSVRVDVSDEGPGISPEHLHRVFERFYRVDPARSREEGGTGLGLAIVKHLVGGHGGQVGIESEEGRGTTVWFTLPVAGRLIP